MPRILCRKYCDHNQEKLCGHDLTVCMMDVLVCNDDSNKPSKKNDDPCYEHVAG